MTTIFKTMRAALKVGRYAVRLFSHHKQIGILGGIDSIEQAQALAVRADYLGADETEIVSTHNANSTARAPGAIHKPK